MRRETFTVISGGKKRRVDLIGINLQRASTSRYAVFVDGRRELVTQQQREAIEYISDLFDVTGDKQTR